MGSGEAAGSDGRKSSCENLCRAQAGGAEAVQLGEGSVLSHPVGHGGERGGWGERPFCPLFSALPGWAPCVSRELPRVACAFCSVETHARLLQL